MSGQQNTQSTYTAITQPDKTRLFAVNNRNIQSDNKFAEEPSPYQPRYEPHEIKYRPIKRLVDILIAGAAVIALSPIFVLISLIIFLDDGFPTVFRQKRSGANGKLFTIYKFRSMPTGAANIESRNAASLTTTRVGNTLRRLSLDELPQLFNVLKGDMSLIGPRPALPSQTELLAARRANGSDKLAPGLSGLAQVNGFDGMSDKQKSAYDGDYARNIGLRLDAIIAAKTVGYLLKRRPPVY